MLKTYKHSIQKFKKNNETNLTYEEWKRVVFERAKSNEREQITKLGSSLRMGEDKELGPINVSII